MTNTINEIDILLIFTDFQIEVFNSSLNISAKYQQNLVFYESKSKMVHSKSKTIEHSENRIITQSGPFENEIRPGVLKFSVQQI